MGWKGSRCLGESQLRGQGRTSSWDPPGHGYRMQWWYCPLMSLEIQHSTRKLAEALPLELMARLTQPALSLGKQQVPKCCSGLLLFANHAAIRTTTYDHSWPQKSFCCVCAENLKQGDSQVVSHLMVLEGAPSHLPGLAHEKPHRRKWKQVHGKSVSVLSLFQETLGSLDPRFLSVASPASPALCL